MRRECKRHILVFCSIMAVAVLAAQPVIAGSDMGSKMGKEQLSPTWRVLVYLDGDNNLDTILGSDEVGVVETDLLELMAVGSTENVDVFTLVDRFAGPAVLYKVHPGELEEMTDYVFHNQEVNMGDPVTLTSFVSYAFEESPAQYTLIVFWDHGTPYYIAWDDHPSDEEGVGYDVLTHKEVIEALDGYHIDILGADECLVGQVEVAYQYSALADVDYLVASECYTGWRGIAYDRILEEIELDREITPEELSIAITEHFTDMMLDTPYMAEMVNSKAAVDLSCMDALAGSIGDLTTLMIPDMESYLTAIKSAQASAQILYGTNAVSRVDLGAFIDSLAQNVGDAAVKAACEAILAAYDAAIIGLGTSMLTDGLHTGLGIYLPLTPSHSLEELMLDGSEEEYRSYAFPQLGWMDFIEAYWIANGGLEAGHA
ncbi:MAG TPA: clostripain-related cysteine peptidase [Thermoplasmata archaeon]|nr:clostripain-related cysteine peptidase [Thermoplasmata archaeon]